jgi:hypothetical protein
MLEGMAIGFTERALIPFASAKALENYIRSEGQSGRGLAQTDAFRKVARHVPARSSAMVYVDGPLFMEAQIVLAEDPPGNPEPGNMSVAQFIRWAIAQQASEMEVDVLKAMRKYQSSLIGTMTTESDGLAFDLVLVPMGQSSGD